MGGHRLLDKGRLLDMQLWARRPVGKMMTEAVVHVEPAALLTRVLQLMVSLKSRSFPVIGPDHQLVGMISRADAIRALKEAT